MDRAWRTGKEMTPGRSNRHPHGKPVKRVPESLPLRLRHLSGSQPGVSKLRILNCGIRLSAISSTCPDSAAKPETVSHDFRQDNGNPAAGAGLGWATPLEGGIGVGLMPRHAQRFADSGACPLRPAASIRSTSEPFRVPHRAGSWRTPRSGAFRVTTTH